MVTLSATLRLMNTFYGHHTICFASPSDEYRYQEDSRVVTRFIGGYIKKWLVALHDDGLLRHYAIIAGGLSIPRLSILPLRRWLLRWRLMSAATGSIGHIG